MSESKIATERHLKFTMSRCLVCKKPSPAEVFTKPNGTSSEVFMRRTCPDHGTQTVRISSDSRFYWLAHGSPENSKHSCGCSGGSCSPAGRGGRSGTLGRNFTDVTSLGSLEKLSTCVALIEIVNSCNLACPTCFADSPVGVRGENLDFVPFDEVVRRIEGVIALKGGIEILQLSGGEPTLHPEFFRLIEWIRIHPKIDYLVINTNGLRFANDPDFVSEIGRLQAKFDNIELYLQFDGVGGAGQKELRGADLRGTRIRAIHNCAAINLPITLAMTVTHDNIGQLGESAEFALGFKHLRGLSFQPRFRSGRIPAALSSSPALSPISVADIVAELNEQLPKGIPRVEFVSLPCGDPNCATIGWLLRIGGSYFSPAQVGIDIAELHALVPDRIRWKIEDLAKCGCDGSPLGEALKKLESMRADESNTFRFFIKPFMDAATWDNDRIDRCCTHVIRPDGKLDSFCRYYSGFPDTWNGPKTASSA